MEPLPMSRKDVLEADRKGGDHMPGDNQGHWQAQELS